MHHLPDGVVLSQLPLHNCPIHPDRQVLGPMSDVLETPPHSDDVLDAGENWFQPGALVLGRFLTVRPIGKDGMGEVYEAEDQHLGRIAIKTIRNNVADQSRAFERFCLDRIVELCLAPDASASFPSVSEVSVALRLASPTLGSLRRERSSIVWTMSALLAASVTGGVDISLIVDG